MKTLNYTKPVCEVVVLEREGYILCASKVNTATMNDMTEGNGFGDITDEQFPSDIQDDFNF